MAKFEVHVGTASRWTVEGVYSSKDKAIGHATTLFGKGMFDGVKVTHTEDEGKRRKETVIWSREREGKAITISPISEAPPCENLEDYYGWPARRTMSRLLRKYFDDQGLTALELLFSYPNLKILSRRDTLFHQGISAVANIQARATGTNAQTRINEIYQIYDQVLKRAERIGEAEAQYALIRERGLDALVASQEGQPAARRDFFVRAGVAALLSTEGDFLKKVELVCRLGELKPSLDALPYLDEVMAELLDSATAVQELLGGQADLGSALLALIRLVTGRSSQGDPEAVLTRLSAVLGVLDLPAANQVLFERIEHALSGTQPLTREGRAGDRVVLRSLVEEVTGSHGLRGGPEIAAGLVQRARITLSDEEIGDLSEDEGIDAILNMLETRGQKLGFLFDLGRSSFLAKHENAVVRAIAAIMPKLTSVRMLVDETAPLEDAGRALTGLRAKCGAAGFSESWQDRFLRKLDELATTVGGGEVGEGLPAPDPSIKDTEGEEDMADRSVNQDRFQAGDYIFREGEPGDEAYLIQAGSVEITKKQGNHETVIAKVTRGAIIGEMALIDDQPRMASARCAESTQVTRIPLQAFKNRLKRLEGFDPVLRRLLDVFVDRIRVQTRKGF